MTFWKLAVGLCRYCLGGLPRILAANLMRILLCRVLSQSFVVRIFVRIFQMGVRFLGSIFWVGFFAEGAKPQNRAFFKNSNPKFEHQSQPRGKVLEGGWAVVETPGGLRLALWLGAVKGNKATGPNCSLVPFHCLPCTVCLEFCEYRL